MMDLGLGRELRVSYILSRARFPYRGDITSKGMDIDVGGMKNLYVKHRNT